MMMEPLTPNTIVKTLAAAKQIEILKKKLREKKSAIQSNDLQSFKDLCCHKDLHSAIIACEAIVDFVKFSNFPIGQAISWFVTLLQSTSNILGITKAITELLMLSIRLNLSEKQVYLDSFQHPFIIILKQDNANWPAVDFQMRLMFNSNPDHVFTVLERVFMYAFWSPSKTVDTSCKRGLWSFLVNNLEANFDYFIRTMCWLQIDDDSGALDSCYFLADLCEHEDVVDKYNLGNLLCIISAENSCTVAEHGHQPELCLQLTKKLLKKYPAATDMALMMLARALLTCPARFLHHFLRTCLDLIKANGFHDVTVVWMIISASLPWLIHSTSAISDIHRSADLIFEIVEKRGKRYSRDSRLKVLLEDDVFMRFVVSSRNGFWAFVLTRALENYSPAELLSRMRQPLLSPEDVQFNCLMNLFISGLLLANDDSSIQKSALDVLTKTNAGSQLPMILFMLSRTSCREVQLALLNALPSTAVDKNNISPILVTLDSFVTSGQKVLIQHSVQLILDLWKIEKRCYPYLSEYLMKNKVMPPDRDWERDVIVASAIRDICTLEPTKYSEEWLAVLSDIMNRCPEQYGSLPFALALEAILRLCEAGVVNVLSVFREFSRQNLFDDKRPGVIERLCELVELIFQDIKETTLDDHRGPVIDAIETMWRLIVLNKNKAIAVAAMKALSKFDVGLMPLKVIPKEYREVVKLPAEYAKKSNAMPEDVLPYVPGIVWITYLQQVPEEIKLETCTMLSAWLQLELNQLGRGFYHSIRGEPSDVSFLHDKSIFKTLVGYLKRLSARSLSCSENEIRAVVLCLLVFTDDNTNKLPQFNWVFLDQFLKYKDAKLTKLLVKFFAKQCEVSMSARKSLEHYIKSIDLCSCERLKLCTTIAVNLVNLLVTDPYEILGLPLFECDECDLTSSYLPKLHTTDEELKIVLNFIPKMCCSVTPSIFSSVLSSAVHRVSENLDDCAESLYPLLCGKLHETLKQSNLDEHNRDAVCHKVIHLWEMIPADDSEPFEQLVDVVRAMPFNYIESLVSPEDSTDLSFSELVKILMLSSTIALKDNENPFMWMNFCIDAAAKCLSEKDVYFVFAADVFKIHRLHFRKWTWLLQLFDRITAAVNESSMADDERDFMYDILIFSVVHFSSLNVCLRKAVSISECEEYFPQAVNNIVTEHVSGQVIEWFYHMIKSKNIGDKHRSLFRATLVALRYNEYFQRTTVWSKIVSECF